MPAFSLSPDPSKYSVTFMGALIKGIQSIKITRDEDSYMKQIGAAGDGARIKNLNKAGSVELVLMQTSFSNDVLSGAQQLDELSGTGHGALLVKDLNGGTFAIATEAWVKKPVEAELGKELKDRAWTLDTLELNLFIGGNT